MYEVRWVRSALDDLTTLWLEEDSSGREAITAATHAMDQLLRSRPTTAGESRTEGRRILFAAPLAITFLVSPEDRVVRVLDVWRVQKRPAS